MMSMKKKSAPPGYNSPEKTTARTWMIELVSSHITPTRVLTFPARKGLCAIAFKEKWAGVHVTGIERSEMIVQQSTLLERNIVDALLLTGFNDMVANKTPRMKFSTTSGKQVSGKNLTKKASDDFDYGVFDFAYLDFCGKAQTFIKDIMKFNTFLMDGGVVALTFIVEKQNDPEDTIRQNGFEILGIHRYKTNVDMILIVAKYPKAHK